MRCGGPLEPEDGRFLCRAGHTRLRYRGYRSAHVSDVAWLEDELDGGRPLVLKLPNDAYREWVGGPSDERADHEEDTLRRVASALGSGPFGVPAPVSGGTTGGAILLAELPGRSLREELRSASAWTSPRLLGARFARAGAWLSAFTHATASDPRPFDPAGTLARAERLLDEVEEMGYPKEKRRWVEGLVHRAARGVEGEEAARCLVHGDFRSQHVYVEGEQVNVIDFEQAREGWAHEDAAYLLAALAGTEGKHPALRWSPGLRAAKRAFEATYRREAPPGWAQVGGFFRGSSMITALFFDHATTRRTENPRLFAHLVLPHYERWFRRWSTELDARR